MKSVIVAAVALAIGSATGAFAKDAITTIKSIDTKTHSVGLDNGTTVKLPAGTKEEALSGGERVTISCITDASRKIGGGRHSQAPLIPPAQVAPGPVTQVYWSRS
jgi:hypothetical protein